MATDVCSSASSVIPARHVVCSGFEGLLRFRRAPQDRQSPGFVRPNGREPLALRLQLARAAHVLRRLPDFDALQEARFRQSAEGRGTRGSHPDHCLESAPGIVVFRLCQQHAAEKLQDERPLPGLFVGFDHVPQDVIQGAQGKGYKAGSVGNRSLTVAAPRRSA